MAPNNPSPARGGGQGGGLIRVLIVDDQALIRAGFRMILEAQPDLEVVGEAADGSTAIAPVRTGPPLSSSMSSTRPPPAQVGSFSSTSRPRSSFAVCGWPPAERHCSPPRSP